jgi:hypothetical protein
MPREKRASDRESSGGLIIFEPGRARKDLIKEVALAWFEIQPREARAAAEQLRELHKHQYNKRTGGWRNTDEYGFTKIRLPATLMQLLRRIVDPKWGDDDKDLIELCRMFPDMIPSNLRMR